MGWGAVGLEMGSATDFLVSLSTAHVDGGTVLMTGPAVEVLTGTLSDAWLAAAGR